MKGSTIAFAALGVLNVGLVCLDRLANRHAKKVAKAEAIKKHGDEVNAILEEVKKRCDVYDNLVKREKDSFKNKRADWIVLMDSIRRKRIFSTAFRMASTRLKSRLDILI